MLFKKPLFRVPTVFQMEATECGAACLGMILAYYRRFEPLENLRAACGVSRNGSKASLILKAAREQYQLEGHGYRVSAEKVDSLPLPCILFWNANHYVVFEGRKGEHYFINDPARGRCRYSFEDFKRAFANVALTFKPADGFAPQGAARGVFATLFPLIGKVKSVCAVLFWCGVLLIVPGILMPAMLQIFIDEVMSTKELWLYPLLAAYAATIAASATLTWTTQVALRRGEIQLAVNSTVAMVRHLLALPVEFFMQRSSADLQARVQMNNTIAEAEAASYRAQIAQVEESLRRCRISSPIDGTVLVKYAEAGELTAAGKPLFKIADLSRMNLRAYITASQLTAIKVGQKVRVFADSGEEGVREYEGTVSWISDQSEFTPKTIQTRDERANLVYAIKVSFVNDGYVKIGMYGDLKF